ncbi:MAG TPA: murein transglycosylase, partial [Magnetospirillaceae bacterium]|nr:murein transglycosylase [Magnetospirillaceae bacterium]
MTLFGNPKTSLLAALLAMLCAAKPALALEDALVCGQETARQEKLQAIPDRLLHAISLVESGRWDADHRATLAWPWTVMAEGEGRFLPSKDAAIAEVKKLQARGLRNIDVGCMQVNLLAHADAFATLDEAFEP